MLLPEANAGPDNQTPGRSQLDAMNLPTCHLAPRGLPLGAGDRNTLVCHDLTVFDRRAYPASTRSAPSDREPSLKLSPGFRPGALVLPFLALVTAKFRATFSYAGFVANLVTAERRTMCYEVIGEASHGRRRRSRGLT